jgi:thimet oligopeptidase
MESVVKGLFDITSSLYGIEYKDVTANAKSLGLPVWHPDVKLYEVTDKATGEMLGRMYTDLYPREAKYNHAACWGLIPRKVWSDGKVQKPLAALVCNFTKPTAEKPSLLPHDEVETFFHEFGHGLHNMLTQASIGRFSGTGVERDFVEAPSQMMENWVWTPVTLKLFAKHYKSGEPLPEDLLKGMLAARTLGSGLETEHQIYYGLTDQAYHTAPQGVVDTTKVGVDLLGEIELYKGVPETWYQAAFGHLIGYHGAYYGYLWSLVFAQDMYQRFEELGVLSPEAGKYYRTKVLARGGTVDAMDMLKDYLGREPKMDAFLRHLGLDPKDVKKS